MKIYPDYQNEIKSNQNSGMHTQRSFPNLTHLLSRAEAYVTRNNVVALYEKWFVRANDVLPQKTFIMKLKAQPQITSNDNTNIQPWASLVFGNAIILNTRRSMWFNRSNDLSPKERDEACPRQIQYAQPQTTPPAPTGRSKEARESTCSTSPTRIHRKKIFSTMRLQEIYQYARPQYSSLNRYASLPATRPQFTATAYDIFLTARLMEYLHRLIDPWYCHRRHIQKEIEERLSHTTRQLQRTGTHQSG